MGTETKLEARGVRDAPKRNSDAVDAHVLGRQRAARRRDDDDLANVRALHQVDVVEALPALNLGGQVEQLCREHVGAYVQLAGATVLGKLELQTCGISSRRGILCENAPQTSGQCRRRAQDEVVLHASRSAESAGASRAWLRTASACPRVPLAKTRARRYSATRGPSRDAGGREARLGMPRRRVDAPV